jgi:TRAP-type C4-dicarboxylate transport system permease large subunit
MNNYEKLYWLTRLNSIHSLFIAIAIISIVALIAIIIFYYMSIDFDQFYDEEGLKARIKTRDRFMSKKTLLIITSIIGVLGSTFSPTQKEAVLIMAGGKTMDFIDTDSSIKKLPEQTTLLISSFFDKQIKELNEAPNTK